jgi:hypothetical protein
MSILITMNKLKFMMFLASVMALSIDTGVASAQSCSSFSNCAQAVQSWKNGNSKLDRDGDGIPCEKLCGKNGEYMPK